MGSHLTEHLWEYTITSTGKLSMARKTNLSWGLRWRNLHVETVPLVNVTKSKAVLTAFSRDPED